MAKSNAKGKLVQYLAGCSASLTLLSAGMVYGWINPVMNQLVSSDSPCPMTPQQASWVATLPELGTLFTAIPGGMLADCMGRKTLLLSSTPMTIVGWMVIYCTTDVYILMSARVLQGLAVGFTSAVLPIYLSEISEPSVRGSLGNFFMMAFTLGQVYEYAIGPFVSYSTYAVLSTVPSWIFIASFMWFHESPYYLLMTGKNDRAQKSLLSFRGEESDEEFRRIKLFIEEEKNRKDTWKIAIKTPIGRRALIITSTIATTVFMGGYSVIITYSSSIFFQTTGKKMSSDFITLSMSIVLCLSAVIGSILLDVWGRRPVMLFSHTANAVCLLCTGTYYLLQTKGIEVDEWMMLPIAGIILASIVSLFGICAIKVYQAELFPTASRGFATGINTFICGVVSSITILMYQPLNEMDLSYVTFFTYTLFSLLGAIFIYYLAPETKGKIFEDIQYNLSSTVRQPHQL